MSRYVCHRRRKKLSKTGKRSFFLFLFQEFFPFSSFLNLSISLTTHVKFFFYFPTICLGKALKTPHNLHKSAWEFFFFRGISLHSLFLFDKLFFSFFFRYHQKRIYFLFILLQIFMIRVLCWIHKHRRAYQNIFPLLFFSAFTKVEGKEKFMNFYACFLMIPTYVATLSTYQMLSLFPLTSHFKTFIHRLITFTSQVRWIWNNSLVVPRKREKNFPRILFANLLMVLDVYEFFFCGLFFVFSGKSVK